MSVTADKLNEWILVLDDAISDRLVAFNLKEKLRATRREVYLAWVDAVREEAKSA